MCVLFHKLLSYLGIASVEDLEPGVADKKQCPMESAKESSTVDESGCPGREPLRRFLATRERKDISLVSLLVLLLYHIVQWAWSGTAKQCD